MASTKTSQDDLLKAVGPDTVGILWFSESPLNARPWPFYTLDYLMDGLLSRYSKEEIERSSGQGKTVFVSQQFEHPFFVGHFQKSTNNLNTQVQETLQVIEKSDDAKKILIIAPKDMNQLKQIKDKLKGLKVEIIHS